MKYKLSNLVLKMRDTNEIKLVLMHHVCVSSSKDDKPLIFTEKFSFCKRLDFIDRYIELVRGKKI